MLNLPSGEVTLNKGDYEISSEDMPGWLVASDGPLTVALDITVTDELRREGTARELINRIQNLRKDSGFDVTDKIEVTIYAGGESAEEISASLESFRDYVAAQTLSKSIVLAPSEKAEENVSRVEWGEGTLDMSVTKI